MAVRRPRVRAGCRRREPTLLDRLTDAGVPVIAIGKIADLFAGRGITRKVPTPSDDAGVDAVVAAMREEPGGLIFANLVDFDTKYGHRNDVAGVRGDNLERFDRRLPEILARRRQDDLLVDHRRPRQRPDHAQHGSLARARAGAGRSAGYRRPRVDLGTRDTFADLGQTVADVFGVGPLRHGASFLESVCL